MTKRQSTLVMLGLLLGILLEALDGTIVGTAMPKIAADLGGLSLLGWVFSAYLLTSTVTTPLYGKLSDLYGRLPFYLAGMTLFMIGSIASGLSNDMTWLIIFRGVQGLGAGAMMPIAIALAQTVFPPQDRGKLQGALSGAFGIASVVGPTLGGFITDHLDWRWVFFINIPLGVLAAVLLYANLPAAARRTAPIDGKRAVDFLGALTLTVFSTALLLGFIWGGDKTIGWTAPQTLAGFLIAAVGLAGFLAAEQRAADPVVPLGAFRNRTFTVSILTGFLIGGAMFAALSYLPLFVQGVLGASATDSGAVTTPMMIALVIGSGFAGRVVGQRIQQYKWLAVAAGVLMVLATALMTLLTADTAQWVVVVAMVIFGLGLGITFPLYTIAVSTTMERRYLGVAIGLLTFFRNLGGAMVVALLGSVLAGQLSSEVPAQIGARLPANVVARLPMNQLIDVGPRALANAEALAQLRRTFAVFDPTGALATNVIAALRSALANAIHTMFLAGLILAVLALLASLALKNDRLNLAALRQQRLSMEHGGAPAPADTQAAG